MTENGLYLRAPTKLELETVKQACREHFILGRPVPEDRMFYEYAEEWYTIRKEPFISDASRASYKSCFIKHILPEFGLQHMKAISANDIQLFVNRFAGSSKSLITLVIGILHGIFSTAYAEGILERDPTVALIRPKSSKKGKPLPHATFKRMWHRLMLAAGCVVWREVKPGTSRPDDILKQIKVTLTPHYFRHTM